MISGDHERTAIDSQKHYRLPVVHLMDTDRALEKQFNRNGWPFLMLVDPQGQIVVQCNDLIDRRKDLPDHLKRMKAEKSVQIEKRDLTDYLLPTLERNSEAESPRLLQWLPWIAADANDRMYVVYTTNENGNNDIFARTYDGEKWSADQPVAATAADEYGPCVAVDAKGKVWASWTSNANDGTYNIYLRDIAGLNAEGKTIQATQAPDDAMYGRLHGDSQGRLWLAYYRWEPWDEGLSRDKEVYVRTLTDGQLSPALHVTPADVPRYEDHTDPAIAACEGQVWVVWSWDYHRPKGYPPEPETPSIFARSIDAKGELGTSCLPVSGNRIDGCPTVVGTAQGLWIAWDSLARDRSSGRYFKSVYVSFMHPDGTKDAPLDVSGPNKHVCSPSLACGPQGQVSLVWSATQDGRTWTLYRSNYDPSQRQWSTPITLSTEGNPRYPNAVYDTTGRLWIAYCQQTEKGTEVQVISR